MPGDDVEGAVRRALAVGGVRGTADPEARRAVLAGIERRRAGRRVRHRLLLAVAAVVALGGGGAALVSTGSGRPVETAVGGLAGCPAVRIGDGPYRCAGSVTLAPSARSPEPPGAQAPTYGPLDQSNGRRSALHASGSAASAPLASPTQQKEAAVIPGKPSAGSARPVAVPRGGLLTVVLPAVSGVPWPPPVDPGGPLRLVGHREDRQTRTVVASYRARSAGAVILGARLPACGAPAVGPAPCVRDGRSFRLEVVVEAGRAR